MMAKKIYMAGFAVAGLMAGGLIVTACAGTPPAGGDQVSAQAKVTPKCLDARNIGRKHVVDDHTLLVYDTWGNPYKMDIGGPCKSMTDFSQIGFEFNGTNQICQPHDAMLLRSENGERPVKCLINSVEPITREDAKLLDKDN
ncbi:DUF6491 family protein [Asticcacaulis taihuensis]|jgi:hypothetical protein|uniref:DUF6491 family protein n=1 Tax=Asticcacaulis taihuensis TaxID=260084 RepID=UPI003F7CC1DC